MARCALSTPPFDWWLYLGEYLMKVGWLRRCLISSARACVAGNVASQANGRVDSAEADGIADGDFSIRPGFWSAT